MADAVTRIRRLIGMPGVRQVSGDAMTLMQKRLPRLPKSQMPEDLLAVDPVRVVMDRYGERADEALARAKMLQESDPLQMLDEGRWFDKPAASGREVPLIEYQRSRIPGAKDAEGLFRWDDQGNAVIQVAGQSPNLDNVLLEESLHAIDRQLGPKESPRAFRAPSTFLEMLSADPQRAKSLMSYFSLPSETRATLSGLLSQSPEFTGTSRQAIDLLERAKADGTLREAATAEGILNSKALRNEYIPYMVKALGLGGVAAGTYSEE